MYKMVVVDDEYLVRRGIKETIEWHRYGIEIVGEATNGKSGLELIQSLKPDIIISDIKMPIMDGLKLVENIKTNKIDCVTIILSGYRDFEYAKNTLEHGAYSYLLKPIDNQELIDNVLNAIKELESSRHLNCLYNNIEEDLPHIQKMIGNDLIKGVYVDIDKIINKINIYNINIPTNGYVIYGVIDNPQINKNNLSTALTLLLEICLQHLSNPNIYSNMEDNYFYIFTPEIPDLEMLLKKVIKEYEKTSSVVVSLGVSNYYQSLTEISRAYQEATKATEQKLFLVLNSVDTYLSQQYQYKPIISSVMQYISQNYANNITVKMVADSLFVSESYLLHMFKDNVGKTFNECLTDYRLLIAQKLLLENNNRVYEVANLVGYPDVKYFSQIFKKKIGMTPSEFAQKQELT